MPPQQAWASRQFIDCESDGKSRAVQCKWCVDKKVAYNSTSRKTSHLKQCVAFNEHVVQLIEAENAGGYLCRELEQIPNPVLEHVLDQTGARRLQQANVGAQQGALGAQNIGNGAAISNGLGAQTAPVLFANNNVSRLNGLTETPRSEVSRPTPTAVRAQPPSHAATPTTQAARSSAYNRAAVDRAFANAVQDSGMPLNAFNASSHPAVIDALRLLDKETRVRIARELLDEAYEEVKRAVDNYIEKQQYLNSIVDDGDLATGDRNGLTN